MTKRAKKKPNIIFVTMDACRPDHLGYMGYKKNTSPFLDSLVKKGTYFTRAFATGPGSPHSFVAIFTSTHPFDYGGFAYIDRPRVLLSEVMQKNGYTTMGIHSAAYMSGYFGYDRGWDKFKYLSPFGDGDIMQGVKPGTWQTWVAKKFDVIRNWAYTRGSLAKQIVAIIEKYGVFVWRKIFNDLIKNYKPPFFIAEEVNEEVKKILPRATQKPLFLWVHYMDPHGPYGLFWKKSRELVKRMKFHLCDFIGYLFGEFPLINKWFLPLYLELYDSSIKYTDEHIEKLFKYLTSIDVLNDESVVVICSDHGEEFMERGWVGHNASLWNFNLNVPLIFYGKKHIASGMVIDRPVSLIDISPTVLDLAGLPKEKTFKGRNIFDKAKRPVVGQVPYTDSDLSNQRFLGASVIYDGYKFINILDQKKKSLSLEEKKMLFSLENDFAENVNLYDKEKEIAERLEKILKPYEFIRSNK